MKSQDISVAESHDLIESDIDPFETIYGESLHKIMESNDQIHTPLFSDKVFLNEIGTKTHILSHVLP